MKRFSPKLHRGWAVLALLFLSQPGQTAQDNDLRLLSEDSPLHSQLAAVGMVIAGDTGSKLSLASGFMISPCHVLTAAHALALPGHGVKIGMSVKFLPKGKNSRSMAPEVWGRVVASDPDFVMREAAPGFNLRIIARDWSLIELDRPLPEIEPIKLLFPEAPIPEGARFSIVGYPLGGRVLGLHAQAHCPLWSGHGVVDTGGLLIADCAVRQGMSGGPLLLEGKDTVLAAGIVVERVEFGSKVMTVAVPSARFAETAVAAMRDSEICAVGSPFTLPPAPTTP